MERRATNVVWHHGLVDPEERAALLGHQGAVVWFTGLSGSGKSTVARELERLLLQQRLAVCVLDGDNLRHGLNADLGFSPTDRAENIRRVGAVAQLISQSGLLCLAAFVSPYQADRQLVRDRVGAGRFIEVFVNTPIEVCEARDPKGLYAKARRGEIKDFTGISAPYEAPQAPEITVGASAEPAIDSAKTVFAQLAERGLIPPQASNR